MGVDDAREYGSSDATVLSKSRRTRVHGQLLCRRGDGVPRARSLPRCGRAVATRLEDSSLTALGERAIRRAPGYDLRWNASLSGPGLPRRFDPRAGAGGTLRGISRWRTPDPE